MGRIPYGCKRRKRVWKKTREACDGKIKKDKKVRNEQNNVQSLNEKSLDK